MSEELDMSQYLDLFIQESDEQLEILEQETLKLEDDPTDDRLQIIFRAAHTLKGSSRAMGFSNFAQMTHEMENVLDQLRGRTLSVNTEIADALLECIDTLGQMAASIQAGNGDNVDCTVLVKTLQAFHGQESDEPQATGSANPDGAWVSHVQEEQFGALNEAAKSAPVFHAQFRLQADCVMKYVRAFMAVSIVQEAGEVLVCCPEQELLEEEKFELDFEIVFQSTIKIKELKKKFSEISEIEKLTVHKWDEKRVKKTAAKAAKIAEAQKAAVPAPAAPSAVAKPGVATKSTDSGQTVRVDVSRLDNLMNLVGELVIDRTRISQIVHELSKNGHDANIDSLGETVSHIGRITSDLQDQIMKVRMLPIETVFNRFPRVVRDLAKKLGKEVNLELVGGDTELDRSVIEIIGDPLLHILRNSVDHGLELPDERENLGKPRQGTVTVSAKHEENHIVIEIVDDGKGIDLDRIKEKAIEKGLVTQEASVRLTDKEIMQFVFHSGLSTADEVSEVSGRGVGMDIVRSNIQKVGGIIDLDSTPGKGTHFSLRLPLTLAIIKGLLVSIWDNAYVLPLGSVIETLLLTKDQIQTINGREVFVMRGVTMPLVSMREVFMVRGKQQPVAEQPPEVISEQPDESSTEQSTEVLEQACPPEEGSEQQAPAPEVVKEAAKESGSSYKEMIYVVVVGLAEQRIGLVVDNLIGEQEVVIKSLSRFCGEISGLSGATILGDGNVALIVDVNGVAKVA